MKLQLLVCIITFRRDEPLRRLLAALHEQRCEAAGFSVLVVDNDPAGSAEPACQWANTSLALSVRYCCETVPGIVAARNRCVSEFLDSDADSLVFIDDDEWPGADDWLERMVCVRNDNAADIVAGDVLSVAGPGTPAWATRILYEPSTRSSGDAVDVFYTGNVLIERSVLEAMAPAFDERFALTGASDYHFALRCRLAGYRAVFADAPVMEEFPEDRATTGWFLRRGFRSGAGYSRSHLLEQSALRVVPTCLFLAGLRVVRGAATVLLGFLRLDRARIVKGVFRMAAGAGTVTGLMGVSYGEYAKLHR